MKNLFYLSILISANVLIACSPLKSRHFQSTQQTVSPSTTGSTPTPAPAPGPTPQARAGADIYNSMCVACHGPLATSSKKGATAATITNALNTVPAMQSFKANLSAADIEAVAEALKTAPTPAPSPSPTPAATGALNATSVQIPLGSRFYMASAFRDIFTVGAKDATIEDLIFDLIVQRPEEMGGSASRFDPDKDGLRNADRYYLYQIVEHRPNSPPAGRNAVTRQGFVLRACQEVLQVDSAVTSALTKAGNLTLNSAANDANLTALYQVFVLGGSPSTQVLSDLKALHARALQISATEAWRFTVLAICSNPAFQAL